MPQLTPTQILEEIRANFSGGARRKFLPGLLLAFIGFLRELDATGGKFQSLEDFFNSYPRQTQTSRGAVNTLIVSIGDGKTLSIRRFYDAAANWFRAGQKRYDYPSSAPHATQAWGDCRSRQLVLAACACISAEQVKLSYSYVPFMFSPRYRS
jgi:hypothetical protein